jgi:hypothetical protein
MKDCSSPIAGVSSVLMERISPISLGLPTKLPAAIAAILSTWMISPLFSGSSPGDDDVIIGKVVSVKRANVQRANVEYYHGPPEQ